MFTTHTATGDPGGDKPENALIAQWRERVGNSDLVRASELEKGPAQIFLKSEGTNPSGSQKDRVALEMVRDALRRGYSDITVATCGNYGASLSLYAEAAEIKARIIIPASFHTPRIAEMERLGAEIVRYPDTYEGCVEHSIELAEKNGWYDANPGGANVKAQIQAYSFIADEIVAQLEGRTPAVVALPVSNGTTLAGIHAGFKRLLERRIITELPKLVAGSTDGMNPIVQSFLDGRWEYKDLSPAQVIENEINEPLINSHSFEGQEALEALRESRGHAVYVTDAQLVAAAQELKTKCHLDYIPAALAGLVALRAVEGELVGLDSGRAIVFLTCASNPIKRK